MKKILFMLCFISFFVFTVIKAEDFDVDKTTGGSTNQNFTVGEVDNKEYKASISWSGLVYNWTYMGNDSTGKPIYEWKIPNTCERREYKEVIYNVDMPLYSDSSCSNLIEKSTYSSLEDTSVVYFVKGHQYSDITISDKSTGGAKITPSVEYSFTNYKDFSKAELVYDDYTCTKLDFELQYTLLKMDTPNGYVYTESDCSGKGYSFEEVDGSFIESYYYGLTKKTDTLTTKTSNSDGKIAKVELPDSARIGVDRKYNSDTGLSYSSQYDYNFRLKIYLDKDNEDNVVFPEKNAVIGAMTITFDPE